MPLKMLLANKGSPASWFLTDEGAPGSRSWTFHARDWRPVAVIRATKGVSTAIRDDKDEQYLSHQFTGMIFFNYSIGCCMNIAGPSWMVPLFLLHSLGYA
jgi:hypothetical protein